jgi:phenylpropionate dioxygenase-like ring-hydroxylating dioxygenase large terminal subunit
MRQSSLESASDQTLVAEPELRWSARYPEIARHRVSTEAYTSDRISDCERERVFKRAWLYVGRVEDVRNAGDYFVKKIDICNTSILVVRGDDGAIRGFHNVCTHRCNELVWDQAGTARGFTCRFHGWTFRPDGQLSGVPDENLFEDFDKRANALKPVAIDSWKGFIFVNLAPAPH